MIDSFAKHREDDEQKDDHLNNKCFLCGKGRGAFENLGLNFEKHQRMHHNIWKYFAFLMALHVRSDEKEVCADQKNDVAPISHRVNRALTVAAQDFMAVRERPRTPSPTHTHTRAPTHPILMRDFARFDLLCFVYLFGTAARLAHAYRPLLQSEFHVWKQYEKGHIDFFPMGRSDLHCLTGIFWLAVSTSRIFPIDPSKSRSSSPRMKTG